ncbi:unnamed protein product, partial [Closterium sp. NIES-54]
MAPDRHRKVHWDAAKRILRYLCSTSGMGLVLGGRGPVVLIDHVDASWVDDSATQRSSQGYTFSLGSGSVSWRSTCLSSVLSSSCEAEIYAGAMAAQELHWLTYLLTDLGEQPHSPPVLYVDNKAMIALCQEHRLEHRTKHIALRYFFARELQQRGQLRLAYVATRANTADIFTKALPPGDHQRFSTVLGLFDSDVLEDRHSELEYLAAASPTLCAMLLSPEGDHDALDIPTPRTYREAVSGPWASQWKAAIDSELASWRSTGTYVDAAPPPRANVVDGMWLFKVKRPPGSPPVFKARYVVRGFTLDPGLLFQSGSWGCVVWSTQSSSVASSSAEAEIYAGAMAAQEFLWLTFLLADLGERPHTALTLFTDNKAMILLCREPRLETRVKHIDVRYFLLRELQRRGQVRLDFEASEANTADLFTKALAP